MLSRLGHGLYKKIDRLKNIFRCIYITNNYHLSIIILLWLQQKKLAINIVCV